MMPNFPLPEETNNHSTFPVVQPPTHQPQAETQNQNPTTPQEQQPMNTVQKSVFVSESKFAFYTGSSALVVSYGEQCIYWEIAPSLGPKKFDWQNNKIFVKMGIEEVDNILDCLDAYRQGGAQRFQQIAQWIQPKGNGTLHFYHSSQKAVTTIDVYIGKNGLPGIVITRNANNEKKQVYFPILPSLMRTFIRVHNEYATEAIKLRKTKVNTKKEVTSNGRK